MYTRSIKVLRTNFLFMASPISVKNDMDFDGLNFCSLYSLFINQYSIENNN